MIFLVVHTPPDGESQLPDILTRWGPLAAVHAVDREVPQRGRIYVAPPDHHLVLGASHLSVRRGPKENGHRPAIDPLFRSAAEAYGRRVLGVILSGSLDDGAAGLAFVKAAGGVAVVQDPEDAVIPYMPRHAIEGAPIDHVLPAAEMAPLIVRLVSEPLAEGVDVPGRPLIPGIPALAPEGSAPEQGMVTRFLCPECGGALHEVSGLGVVQYKCRVGHVLSEQALLAGQSVALEGALWAALRALEDREELLWRIADRARGKGHAKTMEHFGQRAQEVASRAALVRAALLEGGGPESPPGRT
jgi:two-component system chemotaxis response regulator CheB